MAAAMKTYDITIFGVTGFTGKLMLEYWNRNHDRLKGRRIAIAGRSKGKLDQLAAQLGSRPDGQVSVVTADVGDQGSIDRMVRDTKVLISCVGPYVLYGEPCLKACAELGTHYVDITGEGGWIDTMVHKYHATAQRNRAVIIPAAGFDSVPADLLARKAYCMLPADQRSGKHVALTTSVKMGRADKSKPGGGISNGTYQTILYSTSSGRGLKKLADTPSRPRLPDGVRVDSSLNEALYPFELTSDAYVVRRTQRLLRDKEPTAEQFEYAHALRVPNRVSGYLMNVGFFFLWLLCKIPPVLRFLQNRMTVGQGPGEAGRDNARATMRCCLRVWDAKAAPGAPPQRTGVTSLRLNSDGYNITAMTAMECAELLAAGTDSGALDDKGGVVTPAAVLGEALADACEQTGMMQFKVDAKL
eukprot:TRINITY_DN12819_c0_g1_i1.p1 TRINITY_DN12819_c0_g1~~TRINITY_DN12819_c0_g1_i1.p1  ORF type:complete len:442 (+),score=167.84 TRINITY_DN12819_c0_g1_i1:84-1328(+)